MKTIPLRHIIATLAMLGSCLAHAEPATSCIWYAGKNAIYQIDSETNQVARTVVIKDVEALSMNGSDCGVAVLAKKQLYRYDGNAVQTQKIDLQAINKSLANASGIRQDPQDKSLWISDQKSLFHIAENGQLLKTWKAPESIRQITLVLDQSIWVLGKKQIWHYSAQGDLLAVLELKKKHGSDKYDDKDKHDDKNQHKNEHGKSNSDRHSDDNDEIIVDALAIDNLGGYLWLAGDKQLTRINLNSATDSALTITLPRDAVALTLDPLTGNVWLATSDRLLSYGRDGTALQSIDLKAKNIRDVGIAGFDPVTQTIWLGAEQSVSRFSAQGQLIASLSAKDGDQALAVPAFKGAPTPTLTLFRPSPNALLNDPLPTISYSFDALCNNQPCGFPLDYFSGYTVSATLNQQPIGPFAFDSATGRATYTPTIRLLEGQNKLIASASNALGSVTNTTNDVLNVDTLAPNFLTATPAEGSVLTTPQVNLQGTLDDISATIVLNGVGTVTSTSVNGSTLAFTMPVTLVAGANTFTLTALDNAGNSSAKIIHLTYTPAPPATPVSAKITVGNLTAGAVTLTGAVGAVTAGINVVVSNARTQQVVNVNADGAGAFSASIGAQAGDVLSVKVVDQLGTASASVQFNVANAPPPPGGGIIPPDPATLASPIDTTVVTQMAKSTAFLYTGPNAIQTGVAPGTIEIKRAVVLRGKVMTRDNQPLPGVTITILDHPEFGQTGSRIDGMFDMAANGGGYLTVNYTKAGYLPVQRTVKAPWQDFVFADDVVMIALDTQATTIDLTAATPVQIARGSVVTDQDGTRQATLLIPQGTTATMMLANGTTQALTSVTIRATEYTVGINGPKAMPGPLPASSAYTYAVENSIDEAIAAGADTVQFSQPVYQYVDNFLNFPAGENVPSGYYDRKKAAWIPSDNGIVIKVLDVSGGMAVLDTDGSGQASSVARLAELNITDSERTQLAALYAVGKSLWRVPLKHFSPYDYNWGIFPPPDARPPNVPDPDPKPPKKPDCVRSSIIECQSQSFGESVPVTGTPFSLTYKSSRMPGYDSYSVPITLSGASLPASARQILLEITVAGRMFSYTYPASANLSHTFVWDGLDAYNRPVKGAQVASIRIAYRYAPVYRSTGSFGGGAGSGGSLPISSNQERTELSLWKYSSVTLGKWEASSNGLGGWTLNAQHAYDPIAQVLSLGNGSDRGAQGLNAVIRSIAQSNDPIFGTNFNPIALALDAQGNLYFGNSFDVSKLTPEGVYTRIAGTGAFRVGSNSYVGDGGPATAAEIQVSAISLDTQGNLYIADNGTFRIRKVTPAGIISTVAGSGIRGFSADGIQATASAQNLVFALTVDTQGSIYIADYYRIRKIALDGIISTVVGTGVKGFSGDGGLASEATFKLANGLAIDSQGNSYFADAETHRVRKVTPDGMISTIAGNGNPGFSGDGGLASMAQLKEPYGLTIDAQGNVYISGDNRVRRVTPQGIISTVAGNGIVGLSGNDGPAIAAKLNLPQGIAIDPQGVLYIADAGNGHVRKVSSTFPSADISDFVMVSEDGSELYYFDPAGHHQRTVLSATGALKYRFSYDANNQITAVTDGDNDVTSIERDANGQPVAIVAPDGQRTVLTLDGNGYLASISNPALETTRMIYGNQGLLATYTNPRNHATVASYNAQGRLIRDQNAAGGSWDLTRTGIDSNYEVAMTTALGRAKRYRTEKLPTGDTLRTNTDLDGTVNVTLQKLDGTTQTTAADGTVSTVIEGPDPRLGMQAPYTTSAITSLPSGLTSTMSATRLANLSNPSDMLSLLTQTDAVTINGKTFTSVYDATQLQVTSTSPLNRQTITKVNAQSRPLSFLITGIEPVNYSYDPRGRLTTTSQGTGVDARIVSYTYNPQGYVDTVTDALSRITSYTYDPAGRVKTITLPDTRVIAYSYDANGNVESVTPPTRPAHVFAYNGVDLATDYNPPALSGMTVATHYDYNLDKQATKITRPDGQVVDYGYDANGRLASLTAPTGIIGYGYKPVSGQLASVTAPSGINLAYTYDGSLLTGTAITGPVSGSVNNTYDNFLRVSSMSVNGSNIAYSYDDDGLLTAAGSLAMVRDAANGMLTGSTLGQISTTQNYNSFGELAGFTAKQGATVLYDETYTRDKAARIVSKTVTIGGQTSSYNYTYDPNGRLTDVIKDGNAIGHFDYDANGNRTQAYGNNATYDDQDRLTNFGGAQYSYTQNGELTQVVAGADTTGYVYDVYGNLTHVDLPDGTKLDYLVDGYNRRVGKKVNGALTQGFIYQDKLKPAAELDGNGNTVSTFVYAGKANVPEYMVKGGVTYRLITDQLGSVRLVVDSASGQVVQRMDYDEWGNVQGDTNPGFQPFGFAGGLYDLHTKLTRFGARDYDAVTGRWTAKDPIGFGGGDTGLFNYVEGDPISYIDPDGLAKYEPPPNPNKKPPPEHRTPGGERERNVGHKNGEEHSRTPKGQRGNKGSRGSRGFFLPSLIWEVIKETCAKNPYDPVCPPPAPLDCEN